MNQKSELPINRCLNGITVELLKEAKLKDFLKIESSKSKNILTFCHTSKSMAKDSKNIGTKSALYIKKSRWSWYCLKRERRFILYWQTF